MALDQARHVEPRRVQRLQNVVACRRQKPRLGDVGVLGRALGERQFGVEAGELLGAVAHALLQRRIGALELLGGLERRRYIGEGDDEATARHAVGTHLDHHAAIRQPLQVGLAFGGVGGKPPLQQGFAVAHAGRTDRPHEFQDFLQWNPELHQMRRQAQNFAELPVRADQLQIGVEHGDALPHVVERRLQDLPVEVERGVGIIQ